MKKISGLLGFCLALLLPVVALAQGAANPVQIITGTGPVSSTNPLSVTLGGGSGGTAVFGPTASGSASANPPVQVGGTTTGAAGANVAGMAVKPASTVAVATDTSAVVQINPNSPGIIANAAPGTPNTTQVLSVQGETGMTPINVQTSDPCSSAAKSSVAISITTATTTSLVAVSGSTTVYVCGFDFTVSEVITTANTLQFEYGTGAACTSPTVLTGTYGAGGVTAGAPVHIGYGGAGQTIFKSAASNGVCALTAIGSTGSFQGVLTYVQQ